MGSTTPRHSSALERAPSTHFSNINLRLLSQGCSNCLWVWFVIAAGFFFIFAFCFPSPNGELRGGQPGPLASSRSASSQTPATGQGRDFCPPCLLPFLHPMRGGDTRAGRAGGAASGVSQPRFVRARGGSALPACLMFSLCFSPSVYFLTCFLCPLVLTLLERAVWLAAGWLTRVSRPFPAALFIYATRLARSDISTHAPAHEKSQSPAKQNPTARRTGFLRVSVAPQLVCRITFILCLSGNPTPSGSSILD